MSDQPDEARKGNKRPQPGSIGASSPRRPFSLPNVTGRGHCLGRDQSGIAAAPGGLSALSVFGPGLEPFRKDDGGAGRRAPAQGPEEVFGPDQAALAIERVNLVEAVDSSRI